MLNVCIVSFMSCHLQEEDNNIRIESLRGVQGCKVEKRQLIGFLVVCLFLVAKSFRLERYV